MRAIEFETQIEEGLIKIPIQHLKKAQGSVKVIILLDETNQDKISEVDEGIFDQIQIKTKGFRFNREEANA